MPWEIVSKLIAGFRSRIVSSRQFEDVILQRRNDTLFGMIKNSSTKAGAGNAEVGRDLAIQHRGDVLPRFTAKASPSSAIESHMLLFAHLSAAPSFG